MDKDVKSLDIVRLMMSVFSIILGIITLLLVGKYYNNLRSSSGAGAILGLFMMPIFFAVMGCIVINIVLGIVGIKKYMDYKTVALEDRKLKKGSILFKSIIAIIGLSLPMLVVYVCDLSEYNKQKGENN